MATERDNTGNPITYLAVSALPQANGKTCNDVTDEVNALRADRDRLNHEWHRSLDREAALILAAQGAGHA